MGEGVSVCVCGGLCVLTREKASKRETESVCKRDSVMVFGRSVFCVCKRLC